MPKYKVTMRCFYCGSEHKIDVDVDQHYNIGVKEGTPNIDVIMVAFVHNEQSEQE